MLQTFHGAPIAGALLCSAGALSFATGGAAPGVALPAAVASVAGVPPLVWFPSVSTAICAGTVLMQSRQWERRKGSGRFLMLCVLPMLVLCVIATAAPGLLASSANRRRTPIAAWRLVADPAWAALSACLTLRLVLDVPACAPGASRLVDKWPSVAAVAKLVVVDALLGLSASRPLAVTLAAAIGAAVGYVAGLAPVRRSPLMSALDGNPAFEAAIRALAAVVGGGDVVRRMARPQPPQHAADFRDGMPPAAGDGMGRMAAPRPAPAARGPAPAAAAAAAGTPQLPPQDPASVELLMGLGLECSRQEAEQALHLANGNVDAAAALLMDRH